MAFVVGMSGLRLPASHSLHALSVGQTQSSPAAPPVVGSSLRDQSGFCALLHVSTSGSTPTVTTNPSGAVQRVFVPVPGQQLKGSKPVGSVHAAPDPTGSAATTVPAIAATRQPVAQVARSGVGSTNQAALSARQLSTAGELC